MTSRNDHPQATENDDLLVESPMFRFECCEHCRTSRCPRHDGHPDPCFLDPLTGGGSECVQGNTMLGEVVSPPGERA